MKKYQDLWNTVLEQLKKDYAPEAFKEIFSESTQVVNNLNGIISVKVPNVFVQTKINYVYIKKINSIIDNISSEKIRFKFVTDEDIKNNFEKNIPVINENLIYESNLNQNLNFNSFVIGTSNRFAVRSSLMVADQPGEFVNPLYIFGGVGLGKTHLMQSIGNYILENDLNKKVLYITTDKFINDYSKFSQSNEGMKKYDEKYGNLDVLLVDDIQILSNAKKTQDQFFNLFNDMYNDKKQIVITSDCPADQLKNIMDRLTSRFSWGMCVDITKPDLEHRINILKRKLIESSESDKIIDDSVLEYIADNFSNNIRILEGAFRRVLSYCVIMNENLTISTAKEALDALLSNKVDNNESDKYENLKSIVSDFYNITIDDLISKKRSANLVVPRHICMYIYKNHYKLSYKKIGLLLGNKDHSTVISGCARVEQSLNDDKKLKLAVDTIIKKIG